MEEEEIGPDLEVAGLSFLFTGASGATIDFTGAIANIGDGRAEGTQVALYHSTDDQLSTADTLLRSFDLSALDPGALADLAARLTLPSRNGYLGLWADPSDSLPEAVESNNRALLSLAAETDSDAPTPPVLNIEVAVLLQRRAEGTQSTADLARQNTWASALSGSERADVQSALAAAGLSLPVLLTRFEAAGLAQLATGQVEGLLIDRRSPLLNSLAPELEVFEIPALPGLLVPQDGAVEVREGTGGADHFVSGPENELLLGGNGTDTLVLSGSHRSYTLTLGPGSVTLQDRRNGGDGRDSLSEIERIDFAENLPALGGQVLAFDSFNGPAALSKEEFEEITELYISYFNRAPDALGLYYWATEYGRGFTIPQMAENFFTQPETRATYAALLDARGEVSDYGAFVRAVYGNILGRTPDEEGFAYWVWQLENSPAITPPVFIMAILAGAKYPADPTPQHYLDQAYLATKAQIGAHYAVIKGLSDVAEAARIMALFDGTEAGTAEAVAATEALHAEALDPLDGQFLFPLIGVLDDPFALV
jgi:hypothetical protein